MSAVYASSIGDARHSHTSTGGLGRLYYKRSTVRRIDVTAPSIGKPATSARSPGCRHPGSAVLCQASTEVDPTRAGHQVAAQRDGGIVTTEHTLKLLARHYANADKLHLWVRGLRRDASQAGALQAHLN